MVKRKKDKKISFIMRNWYWGSFLIILVFMGLLSCYIHYKVRGFF